MFLRQQLLCRLKLRHPRYFHLRFPVVPHLVSYFPSATFRRKIRAGRADTLAIRRRLEAPGFPEFDYPLVDRDLPADPWVGAAARAPDWLTDAGRYTGSAARLRALWAARLEGLPEGGERRAGERPAASRRRGRFGRPSSPSRRSWACPPSSPQAVAGLLLLLLCCG